ncbi:hypothetical protein V6M85_12195 [Sulfolobus tengchongensis]|uniref:Uncharacterized protein n=1 Tax=Sulfolobus tengchongensis TaxID=207809 RepID=A0AAX4L0F4_9CREN
MNLVDYVVSLRNGNILIYSFYINVKIVLIYNIAQKLLESKTDICIVNYEKFLKFSERQIIQSCNDTSYVIVFEVEKTSELPPRYNLVTSSVKLNKDFNDIIRIDKISTNLYKALNSSGELFLFSVINGEVVEKTLKTVHEEIIQFLREFGGEVQINDVVSIISRKYNISRDNVRVELAFLKDLGLIEIRNGKIILTQLL